VPSPPIRTSNGACMMKSRRARAGSCSLSAKVMSKQAAER
jgi:hypothetical protein